MVRTNGTKGCSRVLPCMLLVQGITLTMELTPLHHTLHPVGILHREDTLQLDIRHMDTLLPGILLQGILRSMDTLRQGTHLQGILHTDTLHTVIPVHPIQVMEWGDS